MLPMNICPEMMKEMYEHMMNHKMTEAMKIHDMMMKRIYDLFKMDSNMHMDLDYMMMMRMEVDKMHPMGLKLGPMRRPKMSMQFIYRMK